MEEELSLFVMDNQDSPFNVKAGFGGVVVRFAEKRWYLREWHSHESLEINLVLRGTGSVLLEDRRYPLLPGHVIWLWPGQRHIPSDWSSDMLMWIVEWKPEFFSRLQRARRGHPKPGELKNYSCRRLETPAFLRVQGILDGVAGMEKPDAFNQGLNFALLAIWDEFVRAKPVAREAFLHPKLEQVLGLMNDLTTNLSLTQLADAVKMSPHYLSVLFQKQTGLSVPDYRNRQRLNQFFSLYRARPEIRLLEHVYEAGFGSYAQFYRIFTEATGQTPRQWLKSNRP